MENTNNNPIAEQLALKAISGEQIPQTFTFKNAALNAESVVIAQAYNGINRNVVAIANSMARVMKDKLYTDDGFASLQEYASATFGMEKASAHQFAAVGLKFGTGSTEYELPDGKKGNLLDLGFSIGKLAEIRNVPDADIQTALSSGTLTADTKQKSDNAKEQTFRSFGKEHAIKGTSSKEPKTKVVPTYDCYAEGLIYDDNHNPILIGKEVNGVFLEDIKAGLGLFPLTAGFDVKQITSGMEGWQAIIAYNPSNEFVRISFKKAAPPKSKKAKSKESLADKLASMSDEEKAKLLALLTGEKA